MGKRKRNQCFECDSTDIISPRRCNLPGGYTLKTYCPKCEVDIESNEYYVNHAMKKGQKDFFVFICPGCASHLHDFPLTKEESEAQNKIAMEIIEEILAEEREAKNGKENI